MKKIEDDEILLMICYNCVKNDHMANKCPAHDKKGSETT
jgi:hypothetical protein